MVRTVRCKLVLLEKASARYLAVGECCLVLLGNKFSFSVYEVFLITDGISTQSAIVCEKLTADIGVPIGHALFGARLKNHERRSSVLLQYMHLRAIRVLHCTNGHHPTCWSTSAVDYGHEQTVDLQR